MTEQEPRRSPPVAPAPLVLDELFGHAGAEDADIFAQLGQDGESPTEAKHAGAAGARPQHLTTVLEPAVSSEEPDAVPFFDETADEPVEVGGPAPEGGDRDFSDLLAEFEAEAGPLPQQEGLQGEGNDDSQHGGADGRGDEAEQGPIGVSAPLARALLRNQPVGSSPFDDLLQHDTEDLPQITPDFSPTPQSLSVDQSPVPTLSIEHTDDEPDQDGLGNGDISMQSLFTTEGDWLADTSVDDSFDLALIRGEVSATSREIDTDLRGQEPLPLEVPEGWINDAGEFVYYTSEEREAVRLAMLGEGGWEESAALGEDIGQDAPDLHSPGLGVTQSENAARRTPIADIPTAMPEAYAPDPYAPSSSHISPAAFSPYTPAGGSSSSNPYFPPAPPAVSYGSVATSYPSASPYDPYAPSSQPLAGASSGLRQSGLAQSSPPAPKPVPPKPQRVVSNAYDPPFLRPQKSFVRPPSAVQAAPAFSPPVSSLSAPTLAPPPPLAPPSGPRRSPSTQFVASAPTPSMLPPPAPTPHMGPPRMPSRDPIGPARSEIRRPSYVAPSLASQLEERAEEEATVCSPPAQQSYAPSHPPSRPSSSTSARLPSAAPSHSAFDPPLRPKSAARTISRASSRMQFSPPPQPVMATPFALSPAAPPSAALEPPPRGPSRGLAHKSSQMFEPPPPARPTISPAPIDSEGQSGRMSTPLLVPPAPFRLDEEDDWRGGPSFRPDEDHAEMMHDIRPMRVAELDQGAGQPSQLSEEYDPEGGMDGPWRDEAATPTLAQMPSRAHYEPPPPSQVHQPEATYRADFSQRTTADTAPRLDLYAPSTSSLGLQHVNLIPPKQLQEPPYDRYAPSSLPVASSSQSYNPYASTSQSLVATSEAYKPYTASSPQDHRSQLLPRGVPQSSSYHPPSAYQPSSHAVQAPIPNFVPAPDPYGRVASPMYGSDYGSSPPAANYFQSMVSGPMDDTYVPQQVLEQRPVSEDPLGRCTLAARNIPLAGFGFGGVIVTAFPASAEQESSLGHSRTPSYGYASGRGQLWIRPVSELVAPAALKANDSVFPGPLVLDPSMPKGSAGDKKKREAVTAYLNARAEEIEKGLPYLKSSASAARREQEGKLVIVRLLAAMILGDGKLSGSPKVDDAVRAALRNPTSALDGSLMSPASLMLPTLSSLNPPAGGRTASASHLAQLSRLVVEGDRRSAAEYAAEQGLWSHALILSSSVDPDFWKDVVSRFIAAELGAGHDTAALKATYSIFSGKTAETVDDLLSAANITNDPSGDRWREVLAAVVFNSTASQLACLDELGHRLMNLKLINAAQACYILSPSSPFGDVTHAAFDKPILLTEGTRDDDSVVFAEVAEYARSLIAVPKGQEAPFLGLPQLLPYKLQRAWVAAEIGEVEVAQRYCNAVEAASKTGKNGPTVLSARMMASLEDLLERLTGTPSTSPSKTFAGRKPVNKAGLDAFGSWIEGRLTKFIAGEEDTAAPAKPPPAAAKGTTGAPVGPFSHFSTISPAMSDVPSRNGSTLDVAGLNEHLGAAGESRRTSPFMRQSPFPQASPQVRTQGFDGQDGASSSPYAPYQPTQGSSYTTWDGNQDAQVEDENRDADTPQALHGVSGDDGDFINPMAALSLGGSAAARDYNPQANDRSANDDEEDDLGFGNKALSRNRTPMPANGDANGNTAEAEAKTKPSASASKAEPPPAEASPSKGEAQKSGWLRGWWGKKEGETSGPIKAKLGDENKMVFDEATKRWVVKGAQGQATPPPAVAPPPRAQTASPSRSVRPDLDRGSRAMSSTPPPSQLSRTATGPAAPSGSAVTSEASKRTKSGLAESVTAGELPPSSRPSVSAPAPARASASSNGPPPPPGAGAGPPRPGLKPPGASSIDDLLSRPPSKRPGSAAAKKGARNRYVDVFQPMEGS